MFFKEVVSVVLFQTVLEELQAHVAFLETQFCVNHFDTAISSLTLHLEGIIRGVCKNVAVSSLFLSQCQLYKVVTYWK